jgi:hypothetical protein
MEADDRVGGSRRAGAAHGERAGALRLARARRIAAPRAFADPAVSLPIERRADHLEIAAAPAGDLRLVEAGIAPRGNVFTLQLRGAPVAKTEVKVFGPPRWEKAFRTDDQGRVTIATPWPPPPRRDPVVRGGSGHRVGREVRASLTPPR